MFDFLINKDPLVLRLSYVKTWFNVNLMNIKFLSREDALRIRCVCVHMYVRAQVYQI